MILARSMLQNKKKRMRQSKDTILVAPPSWFLMLAAICLISAAKVRLSSPCPTLASTQPHSRMNAAMVFVSKISSGQRELALVWLSQPLPSLYLYAGLPTSMHGQM